MLGITPATLPPVNLLRKSSVDLKNREPAYAPCRWSPGITVIESALQTQLSASLLEFKHGRRASFLTPAACLIPGGFALGLSLPHGMSGVIFGHPKSRRYWCLVGTSWE